jgi:hypothetical protein
MQPQLLAGIVGDVGDYFMHSQMFHLAMLRVILLPLSLAAQL